MDEVGRGYRYSVYVISLQHFAIISSYECIGIDLFTKGLQMIFVDVSTGDNHGPLGRLPVSSNTSASPDSDQADSQLIHRRSPLEIVLCCADVSVHLHHLF